MPATARTKTVGHVSLLAAAALIITVIFVSVADAWESRGSWYFDRFGIETLHARGITGEGVTLAVIDTPINPAAAALAGADITVRDDSFCFDDDGDALPARSTAASAAHGTATTAMIVGAGGATRIRGVAPEVSILFYAAHTGSDAACNATNPVSSAIEEAVSAGADIISISLSGGGRAGYARAVEAAHAAGVIIVAALPNQDHAYSGASPADIEGVVAVHAIDQFGHTLPARDTGAPIQSPYVTVAGPGVDVLAPDPGEWGGGTRVASGNSFAAPFVAAVLALGMQAHPSATPEQLVDALVVTTGGREHEPSRDGDGHLGFGIVNPATFIDTDVEGRPTRSPHELTSSTAGDAGQIADMPGEPEMFPTQFVPLALVVGVLAAGMGVVVGDMIWPRRRRAYTGGPESDEPREGIEP